MIFYEAPHKLRGTLDDLAVTFGTDRSVSLCRELTKLHEEIKKTTLGEAVAFYRENDPRGEYVLVLAGADPAGWPRKPPPHWKKRWLQPALCRQAVCRPRLQPNRRRRGRHSAKGRSTKS